MSHREAPKRNFSPSVHNRKARHEYHIVQAVEAGIALVGTEVKSIRLGEVSLDGAFAKIVAGEAWLVGCHINPYVHAVAKLAPNPDRERKLLLHRRQIHSLAGSLSQKGFTLVPLSIYFKDGRVKVELGLARGKQQFDRRQDIRKREQRREIDQAMRRRR